MRPRTTNNVPRPKGRNKHQKIFLVLHDDKMIRCMTEVTIQCEAPTLNVPESWCYDDYLLKASVVSNWSLRETNVTEKPLTLSFVDMSCT